MDTESTPEQARARAYHRRQLALSLAEIALTVVYLLALIQSAAAVSLTGWLARWTPHGWLVLALTVVILAAGHRLLTMPLTWISRYWLPRRYGLLHQSFRRWLLDVAKAALVGGGLGLAAVLIVYGLMRLTPWWWLWATAVFLIGYALLALVAPIWLVPLFYRLTPLPDGPLKTRLLALAERVAVPVTGIWVVDQSRRSRTANAAVTGLGRTRRILLFDTLLSEFGPDEIEAVVAHELAHQLHGDIPRGLLVQGALTLVTFWVASQGLQWGARVLHLEGPADPAGLPVFGLILLAVSVIALPMANAWSRHVERGADRFALETIADSRAFIGAMERLAGLNLAERDPHPVEEFFLYSHPSIGRRIAMARQFRPTVT
ncbi:MAG TPA: M48 family metallopeptidase [Methylomirabilota bacterium]